MNKFKKFLIFFSCLVFIFSLVCLPVSAIEVGGATINIVGGSFFVPGSDISDESVRFLNASEGSSYDAVMSLINPLHIDALWECAATFSFSSTNNNGSLSIQLISDGTVSRNSYTDIYAVISDGTTERLNAYITYGNNTIDFEYEGVVPSRFKVVSYSNYLASDSTLREEYYNIIFEPGISLDTQEIIANQDKNASDIQANQDKNTSEILNGWQSDEEVSSGESDNLASIEDELITGNQQAAEDEMSNVNDNILGSLQRLYSSFGASGSLFRDLTVRVPDFSVLVYFSLAIGVLPLIVGLSINGLRASDRSSARQRQEAAYKRGYNSCYTRGKGG